MSRSVLPLVLSGGSGTRLWPLSRERRPKQLLPLISEHTLLQETLLRLDGLRDLLRAPIVVCNESHRFLVAEQLRQIDAAPQTIVLEPVGRNTAPAVAVAALLALEHAGALHDETPPGGAGGDPTGAATAGDADGDDPLMLVLPADHVVLDSAAFVRAIRTAVDVAGAGYLVTFGIVPDKPETGYGYLLKGAEGDDSGEWFHLAKFVEKPEREAAAQYVESGRYLWNSGMFVLSARRYLEELERYAPRMAEACGAAVADADADRDFTRLGSAFRDCPSDSIDYAVMEKTARAAVVPLEAGWNDIGSWAALHEVLPKDDEGNVLRGDVLAEGCRNTYISSSRRLVTAVGIEDHIIVETEDAVLVMARRAAQDIKLVVGRLKSSGRNELTGE